MCGMLGVVLNYLDSLGPASRLDLKTLTKNLTTLPGLLTGQRCQTLTMLDTKPMQETPEKYIFTIAVKLKTTNLGKDLEPINIEAYNTNVNLCVVSHLRTTWKELPLCAVNFRNYGSATLSLTDQFVVAQSASRLNLF